MKVLVTNAKGIWTFDTYAQAAAFRQDVVWNLSEAEFQAAYTQVDSATGILTLQYSHMAHYTGEEHGTRRLNQDRKGVREPLIREDREH